MSTDNWISVETKMPPLNEVVDTKIDDGDGIRNLQQLKRRGGSKLWWHPDGGMYVYYTPTHWKYPSPPKTNT